MNNKRCNNKFQFFILSIVLFLLTISAQHTNAQYIAEDLPEYSFVNYEKNELQNLGDSSKLINLFQKLDTLILEGRGKIKVVHIGGSHIQAGILPSLFAKRLQTFFPGLEGSRGFVFPYRIAKTNNPVSYQTQYGGIWQTCKSTNRKQTCTLGLSGISATTYQSDAWFTITAKREDRFIDYQFNRIKILHQTGAIGLTPIVNDMYPTYTDTAKGYSVYDITEFTDSLRVRFKHEEGHKNFFTLYGVLLENDEPGITYYPIGVNGTTIPTYLKSSLLQTHLNEIEPDWIILTLGTNDSYGKNFHPEVYKKHYKELIQQIRDVVPNASIWLTVPNDCYLFHRYPNKNVAQTAKMIEEISAEEGLTIWNFYEIMGGLGSIAKWKHNQLAGKDLIHLTATGYSLQADLLFAAFVKSYEKYHSTEKRFK